MPHGTFGPRARALVADLHAKRHSLQISPATFAAGEEEAAPEAVGNLGGRAAEMPARFSAFVEAFFASSGSTLTRSWATL